MTQRSSIVAIFSEFMTRYSRPQPHAIEAHPMASRIQMIQGSSIAPDGYLKRVG
jgi:hypothetical protein